MALTLPALESATALDYEKDIMPIFEAKCFKCHSDEAEKLKGGLRLDNPRHFHQRFPKDDLVTPGDPKMSGLYYALTRPRFDKGAMPPKKKGEQLTEDEVRQIRDWILEGAPIAGTRGRRGKPPQDAPSTVPVEREWTNREGKKITAALLRVENDMAVLRLANGRVYHYPIEKLSDESRALLKGSSGK